MLALAGRPPRAAAHRSTRGMPDGYAPQTLALHRLHRVYGGPRREPQRLQQRLGPGWHTFQIDNQSTGGGEIDLINPANGAIYAEVENTGPGTITPMRLNLGSGTYAFMCNFNDFNTQVGTKVTVGGHAKGTPAV